MARRAFDQGTIGWEYAGDPGEPGGGTTLCLASFPMPENGWVTGFRFYMYSSGTLNTRIRACIYRDNTLMEASPAFAIQGNTTQAAPIDIGFPDGVRFNRNQGIRWGYKRVPSPSTNENVFPYITQGITNDFDMFHFAVGIVPAGENIPPTLPGASYIFDKRQFLGWVDYQPNVAPSQGSWGPAASEGVINSTTADVRGFLFHDNGDGPYDYSKAIQVQIFDAATNVAVVNQILATTTTEQNNQAFARSFGGLQSGKAYYMRYRHQDSWDVWSAFAPDRSFSVAQIPDSPTPVSPLVKLDSRSGYEYRMTHNHPEGRPIKAVEVQLYNSAGTTQLWTSGVRTLPSQVAAGATFGTAASSGSQPSGAGGHPTLAWGTGYSWRARVQDTLDAWSNFFSPSTARFSTNATPTAPTNLVPQNNSRTGNRTFTATVSDPDGDQITAAQIELVNVSTGQIVSGYPRQMTVEGNRATYLVPEADLVAGVNYRWRARATDGLASGYGPWSAYNQFLWANAATVMLLTPSQSGRTNMVAQPSAEFDPALVGEWWTVSDTSESNYIERVRLGEEAAYGAWGWRAVVGDPSGPKPVMRSPMLPVDELERHMAQVELKRVIPELGDGETLPDIQSRFEVECYDASGALLSSVVPNSVAALGENPPGFWKRYGGAVWPSDETGVKFPAGTKSVRVALHPVSSGTGEVLFDAVGFELMPASVSGPGGAGGHFSDSSFFGYADPSIDAYGGEAGVWMGEEGNSESDTVHVLQDPAQNHVMYSYAHPTGLALNATRVIVQRFVPGEGFRPHHDSGFLAPASTPTVSLPDYLFRNETRYRAMVQCRDSQSIVGQSEWVEFIARFVGPPELEVFSYSADSSRATITVSFESTGLAEEEFGGIEVARSADGEPMRVVEVIRNTGASSHTYHFPVSRKPYRFFVRQVRLVGPEQIEGRWRSVDASVDLGLYNFLKNANRPEEYVVFQHSSGAGPNQSREAPGEGFTPWGAKAAVHLFAEGRPRSDTTSFMLFDGQPQSPEERLRTLKWWEETRPPLCLLARLPEPEKTFIAMSGAVRFPMEGRIPRVEFEWTRTSHSEDAYAAEGAVDEMAYSDLSGAM